MRNTEPAHCPLPTANCPLLLGLWILGGVLSVSKGAIVAQSDTVFVSILPQAYFVERIALKVTSDELPVTSDKGQVAHRSSLVISKVEVMVRPGGDPHTYEPTPKQMAALAEARIYFTIGVPFERAWMERIKAVNPGLKVIDTSKGIIKRSAECGVPPAESVRDEPGRYAEDPHVWLDPILVKSQAQIIAEALVEIDPDNRAKYQANLEVFLADLDRLDSEIKKTLHGMEGRTFLVFHPAWGYFADRYGLHQMPVEVEGKEPGARSLADFIQRSKTLIAEGQTAKALFVQKQFSTRSAETVAQAIGARVIPLDPLAKDYLENLRWTAEIIRMTSDELGAGLRPARTTNDE
jgi:zinc transport system substrate-binding protein